MILTYRPGAFVSELQPGECTVRASRDANGIRGWRFLTLEANGGAIGAWVNPGGGPIENGPCGRTWGLTKSSPNTWQISPSIDAGPQWHHTPTIVGVPDGEPWQP